MKINKFEDSYVWQNGRKLTLEIYSTFKNNKDYDFKNQIQRASVSIMNNIAEGFERMGDKEFKYFLFLSKGSSGEIRSMLYLAKDLNYIDENKFNQLYELTKLISGSLANFIKTLNNPKK